MILTAPLYLAFLVVLPLLWWLVRALPPRPQEASFPPVLLLRKLVSSRRDARHTPFWLLLLRLLIVGSFIIAFTGPVLHPTSPQQGSRNLVLILDNGWASAPHWAERLQTARNLGGKALYPGGKVTVFLSARGEDGQWPAPFQTSDRTALHDFLGRLHPEKWPVERATLAHHLSMPENSALLAGADITLLSDAILSSTGQEAEDSLRASLKNANNITDIRWPVCDIKQLHHLTAKKQGDDHFIIETLPGCPSIPVMLDGLNLSKDGHFRVIAHWEGQTNTPLATPLPAALTLPLNAVRLNNSSAPEGIILLSAALNQSSIGLLRLSGDETPLTGSAFYLTQALPALGPVVSSSTASSLISQPLAMIIAPDGSLNDVSTREALAGWVKKGGILVRFAGHDMAGAQKTGSMEGKSDNTGNDLLPVPLLQGMRQLGGPMSWGVPQKLAPFPPLSPFAGLAIPDDVTISRQVLAKPSDDLQNHVWATLADGTPLVTARRDGNGMIILFHTTPTANWSNLPLSDLFPQMLERLLTRIDHTGHTMSSMIEAHSKAETSLAPWKILDRNGVLQPPSSFVRPLEQTARNGLGQIILSPFHPAGFYGAGSTMMPLNLDSHYLPLRPEPLLGTPAKPDLAREDYPLAPFFALFGLVLLIIDNVLSLYRGGGFHYPLQYARGRKKKPTLFSLGFLLCLLAGLSGGAGLAAPNSALGDKGDTQLEKISPEKTPTEKTPTEKTPLGALETSLAYIKTGDEQTDKVLQEGLDGLVHFVNQRSTAHLGKATSVVPGQDNLAFYPLLYWAISPRTTINPAQRDALNDYIHHNGLLIIDEMGADTLLDGHNGDATHAALRRATQGLDIPPLTVVGEDHVLTHSFYLLKQFPGRIGGQPIYVAQTGSDDGDNVSPVIIGNSDWVHAWAVDENGNTPFAVLPDAEHQRVLAYRTGMNIVMYALTGNYKNDQRLYPEMLHRLKSITGDSTPSETGAEGEGATP